MNHTCKDCCPKCGHAMILSQSSNLNLTEQYKKLYKLISDFELSLDFKVWRPSEWVEKGSCYALLQKAYKLIDTVQTRYHLYTMTSYYDPAFQRYIMRFKNYFKFEDLEEVSYLLEKVFIPHIEQFRDDQWKEYFQKQNVTFGLIDQPKRFKMLCQQLKQKIKDQFKQKLPDQDIVQYAKQEWMLIFNSFGKDLRKERLQELVSELEKSLVYQKKKISVIKQLVSLNKLENEESFLGVKGRLLKQVLAKGCQDTYLASFQRYNSRLFAERKSV